MFGYVSSLFRRNQGYPLSSSDEMEFEAPNSAELSTLVDDPVLDLDIRSTTIRWFSKTKPNAQYIELKGEPMHESKGYSCECTLFANSGPPAETLGQPMDIYLDTESKCIFSRVNGPQGWRQWPNTATPHANPVLPEFRLVALHGSGIRWGTRNSFFVDKSRYQGVVSINDCVDLTLASHSELALDSLDYDALRAELKVKWGKDKVKKEAEDGVHSVSEGDVKKSGEEGGTCDEKEEEGSYEEKMREGEVGDKEENKGKKRTRVTNDEDIRVVKKRKEEESDPKGERKRVGDKGDKRKKKKSNEDADQTLTTPRQKFTITIPKRAPASPLPSSSTPAAALLPPHISTTPSARSSLPSSGDQSPSFPEHYFDDSSRDSGSSYVPRTSQTIPPFQQLRNNPKGWLDRAGKEFPKTAAVAEWVSGIFTVIPWMTDAQENPNPDVEAVNHMALAPDITNPDDIRATPGDQRVDSFKSDPALIVMHWTDELQSPQSARDDVEITGFNKSEIDTHQERYSAWLQKIETHLAAGRVVVVRGWRPNATTTWDVSSISKFKGSMSQPVEYQDATARTRSYTGRSDIHKTTSFQNFIRKGTKDPINSGNCLDSPGLRAEYPPFILPFADCTRALELTRMANSAQLPLCAEHAANQQAESWITETKRKITGDTENSCGRCKDIKAMRDRLIKERDKVIIAEQEDEEAAPHHQESGQSAPYPEVAPAHPTKESSTLGLMGHISQIFFNFGFCTVSWDAWKSCLWDLFTHAGFFTYVHHDAGGFATYAFIREGCKIWGIHRPLVNATHNSRSKIYDVMRAILRQHGILDYMTRTELYSFFLMKGDVLIQPPNTIHQVFTPINCIASGGHFYSWCMLHLTEWARRYDFFYSHLATNADHESAFRYVCRLAMSLRYVCTSRKFLRRPILSMILMILKPENYEPSRFDSSARPGLSGWDLMRLETQADHAWALEVVEKIMKHHKLDVDAIEKELDVGGVDWAKAGDQVIDLGFLAKFHVKGRK